MNDLMIPAGQGPGYARVEALPKFEKSAPEIPLAILPATKAYHCSMQQASFIRTDGKKIPFVNFFHETNIKGDIEYLDAEIAAGNSAIRPATPQEVETAHMQMDPRGTIRKQIAEEVRATEGDKIRNELLEQLKAAGVDTSALDASKLQGVDAKPAGVKLVAATGMTATPPKPLLVQPTPTLQGISGTDKTVNAAPQTPGTEAPKG